MCVCVYLCVCVTIIIIMEEVMNLRGREHSWRGRGGNNANIIHIWNPQEVIVIIKVSTWIVAAAFQVLGSRLSGILRVLASAHREHFCHCNSSG